MVLSVLLFTERMGHMDLLEVGKIVNTHGLRGEVKVVPWTDTPDVFEDLSEVYAKRKSGTVKLTLQGVKYQKNNIIARFAELSSIEEAEPFKNCILAAERSQLGPLEDGAYYVADLIGLTVKTEDGTELGAISDVFQTGANDVYEVRRLGQKNLLLPVIPDVVLRVDLGEKTVTVKLMEGLLDL